MGRKPRDCAAPAQVTGKGLGILSDQHGDGVAVRCDQCLERLNVRLERCHLALCQRHVQLVGQAAIKPGLGQVQHLPTGFDVTVENLKALLTRPQIEIETGDVGGDHHINPVARFLESFGGVDLRLEASRYPAENIDLPFGVQTPDLGNLLQARVVGAVAEGLRSPALGLVGSGANAAACGTIDLRQRAGA